MRARFWSLAVLAVVTTTALGGCSSSKTPTATTSSPVAAGDLPRHHSGQQRRGDAAGPAHADRLPLGKPHRGPVRHRGGATGGGGR